ncbi:MAG: hypothetical protein JXR71_10640 [Bacteroidales bacterium]|nr:hypothetical protein [Bacteroidales bacterium]
MKSLQLSAFFVLLFLGFQVSAQNYVDLKLGESKQADNIKANFNGAIKKSKKGEDYYRVTVTITNEGMGWHTIFDKAMETYVKSDKSVIVHVNFTNATGRGLSATTGKIYGNPIYVDVPIRVKKCPPPKDKKEDPYNHFLRRYVVGVQFENGASLVHSFNIRVNEGVTPQVRVMLQ